MSSENEKLEKLKSSLNLFYDKSRIFRSRTRNDTCLKLNIILFTRYCCEKNSFITSSTPTNLSIFPFIPSKNFVQNFKTYAVTRNILSRQLNPSTLMIAPIPLITSTVPFVTSTTRFSCTSVSSPSFQSLISQPTKEHASLPSQQTRKNSFCWNQTCFSSSFYQFWQGY